MALSLWGDAALWYKLAEANGLGADAVLVEGQRLSVPAGVTRSSFNADTLKPYDANDAIGNVSPTTPKPKKKNNCGVFGQILLAAVAIAVVALVAPPLVGQAAQVTAGTAGIVGTTATVSTVGLTAATGLSASLGAVGGALAGGALAGAAGSIVSQGVGIATGIQDKFSWRAVAMAGVATGAGGRLAAAGVFGGVSSQALQAGLRGAAGSAISQGIGVATGLQSKFSWTGVAAAGIGAGVGSAVARELNLKPFDAQGGTSFANIAGNTLAGTASAMANAATRSAINGTSFGDNLMRALPDVIANTIGNLVAHEVASAGAKKPAGGTSGSKGSDGTAQGVSAGSATDDTPQPGDNGNEIIVTAHRKGWSIGSQMLPPLDVQNEYLTKLPGQVIKIRQTVDGPDGKPRSELMDYTLKGPGFHFVTIDDAVVDAIGSSWWLRETMQDNFERGGDIIRLKDGTFTYNDIQTGDFANPSSESAVSVRVSPTAAAWFHLHPAENPSEKSSLIPDNDRANVNFSRGDVDQATAIHNGLSAAFKTNPSITPNIPSYLGVYNGSIVRNDSLWNGVNGSYTVKPARFFGNISPYIGR